MQIDRFSLWCHVDKEYANATKPLHTILNEMTGIPKPVLQGFLLEFIAWHVGRNEWFKCKGRSPSILIGVIKDWSRFKVRKDIIFAILHMKRLNKMRVSVYFTETETLLVPKNVNDIPRIRKHVHGAMCTWKDHDGPYNAISLWPPRGSNVISKERT